MVAPPYLRCAAACGLAATGDACARLNQLLGWWWADPAAAFVIVYYGLREGWRALHETME